MYETRNTPAAAAAAVAVTITGLLMLAFAPIACTQVEEREVGVYTWDGKMYGSPLTAGLHWHNPFRGNVVVYDTGFVTSRRNYKAKSAEMQELTPPVSVTHRLNPAYVTIIHSRAGNKYFTELVEPNLISTITADAVQYNIDELHANREQMTVLVQYALQQKINEVLPNNLLGGGAMQQVQMQVPVATISTIQVGDGVDDQGQPRFKDQRVINLTWESRMVPVPVIEIQKVVVEDWGFSEAIKSRIEDKQSAIQEAERRRNEVEAERAEADKKIQEARGRAESAQKMTDANAYERRTMAKAEAEAILAKAEAEAQAIKQVTEALANQPGYIDYLRATRWDGQLPSSLMLGGDSTGQNRDLLAAILQSVQRPVAAPQAQTQPQSPSNE